MRSKIGMASDSRNNGECCKFEANRRHSRTLYRKFDRMSDDDNLCLTQNEIMGTDDDMIREYASCLLLVRWRGVDMKMGGKMTTCALRGKVIDSIRFRLETMIDNAGGIINL